MRGTGTIVSDGGMVIDGFIELLDDRTIVNPAGRTAAFTGASPWLRMRHNSVFDNRGTFDAVADNRIERLAESPLFRNSGTFNKLGPGDMSASTLFENSDTVDTQNGTFTLFNDFTQTAGATILRNATELIKMNGLPLEILGGRLVGIGTVTGNTNNSGGEVGPGLSPGLLTMNGTFSQTTPGAFRVELAGTTPETEYDVLDVSGDASLGGTPEVVAIDGFVTVLNDAFEVVRAGAVIGQFDQVNLTNFPSQLDVDVTYGPMSVTVTVVESTSCDPCDTHCDGDVNAFDIESFLDLLFDPNAKPCNTCIGDVNGDDVVDAFDIEPFLECLFP